MSFRSHLSRYVVTGTKVMPDGTTKRHREEFTNGRDAYIIESYLKREGYKNVSLNIKKAWHAAPKGAFLLRIRIRTVIMQMCHRTHARKKDKLTRRSEMDIISQFAMNHYWAILLAMVIPAQIIVTVTVVSELKNRWVFLNKIYASIFYGYLWFSWRFSL